MNLTSRFIVYCAMTIMTIVSIWTTYVSLEDSILPEPILNIPLWAGQVWKCSVFALGFALALDLMLYGMKLAIIDGQKRLSVLGFIGMTVIAFISIAFNIDVLYRTADRDFFLQYSTDKVRSEYTDYLAQAQSAIGEKRIELLRSVAKQEGELESEIKGIRKAPSGYGTLAKEEDYALTLMRKESEVELKPLEEVMAVKAKADALLAAPVGSLREIGQMQTELRVVLKDMGAVAGIPLPPPVKLENPLFAVFEKLSKWDSIGAKEIFIIAIAFFLDLGDIIGYALIPNAKKDRRRRPLLTPFPPALGPEIIPTPAPEVAVGGYSSPLVSEGSSAGAVTVMPPDSDSYEPRSRRTMRFGRR